MGLGGEESDSNGEKTGPVKSVEKGMKLLKKARKTDVKVIEGKERSAFKFPLVDKKLTEDQVKKTRKKECKTGPFSKKLQKEKSSAASGSGVFDHEDDPELIKIIATQRQEARVLSRRSREGTQGNQSLARMVEKQICQSEGAFSRSKRKLSESKAKHSSNPDYFTPSIDDLLKLPVRPDDGSKTQEEILDELDVEIAKRHKRQELDGRGEHVS